MSRTALRYVLEYGLGLGLLGYVVWSNWHIETPDHVEVGLAAALQRPLHVPALLAAAALSLIGVSLTFVRWYVLVRSQEMPFTLRSAFRLGLIGYYFSMFLPGSVGGDVIKAACVAREQKRRTVAVATVLLDRVIGLIGLFCLVLVVGAILWFDEAIPPAEEKSGLVVRVVCGASLAALVLVVAVWVLLRLLPAAWELWIAEHLERIPRIGAGLRDLWHAAWIYRAKVPTLVLTVVMALASHAVQVLAFYEAASSLLPEAELPSIAGHFVFVPAGFTIQAGVPFPGGIGVGEYGFGTLYQWWNSPFAAGVLGALAYRVIVCAWGLAGYFVYWRLRADMPAAAVPTDKASVSTAV